ncbi:MAG: PQQ-binding-like beta-propeller repeat protein [Planctomycetaceae bacterium]|jgi:outer membrane protein assembly factor BamB|nr:PQQ-binding-like beta-propeller repeat protein [Planctomycetaceae bacterium]MBT6494389.1 PQQ-binding-like beta-propeller repeat protein [Planctomycetaceae bacterium]
MNATTQFLFCMVLSLTMCDLAGAENWIRFRGPNGQGVSSEVNLPITWSANDKIAWKTSIPGDGWSSPIVYKQHVFLTTATEDGVSCRVICVNREDGSIAWNTEVHRQKTGPKRRQNSFATPTPVTDGERVYAVFYDGTVVCVDFAGKLVWKNHEIKFFSLHGLGASPVLAHGQLIMPFDGSSADETRVGWKVPWKNAIVLSLDAEKGSVRWKGKRGDSRVGHVTPILIEDGTQIVSAGGDRVQGFNARTGKRIWSIYSQGEGVTPSPVVGDGLIFTSSGFEAPTIRAIRLGGTGDITKTHIAWEQRKGVPALASPLFVDPYLYTITRDNILHCFEASTGKPVWLKRLTGVHSASPVYADGRIYVLSEDGVTLVLRPGPRYDEVARNSIGERCLASMAVSQGQFYIRSSKHLFCIGKSSK